MKEHPIIFSSAMVRAILEGRKTQTRRVISSNPQIKRIFWQDNATTFPDGTYTGWVKECDAPLLLPMKCPYGTPGELLWVRETFMLESNFGIDSAQIYTPPYDDRPIRWTDDADWGRYWELPHYKATDEKPYLTDNDDNEVGWKPSIHMPRWASRITLEVVSVRVERVQDISEEDAVAEGCNGYTIWGPVPGESWRTEPKEDVSAIDKFATLWDSINAKRGFSWDINPWVWVVEFKRVDS